MNGWSTPKAFSIIAKGCRRSRLPWNPKHRKLRTLKGFHIRPIGLRSEEVTAEAVFVVFLNLLPTQ